jgi:RecB family exonuclease
LTLPRLPAPVESVDVPPKLGPTQIARAIECRLSGVLPSSLSESERLPPDPRAILGSLLHRLVQDARRGLIPIGDGTDVSKAISSHLERLIAEREAELAKGPLAHYIPLKTALTFSEYLDRTSRATARARAVFRPPSKSSSFEAADREDQSLDGVEVKISSDTLGLKGSMDACRETDDEVEIRDLKTGNARDANGIAPHVRLQLGLYALIVHEMRPNKRIRLFVDHASTDELPWGAKEEAATRDVLASIRNDIGTGGVRSTRQLARPGSACRWCEARHVCPAYRDIAPAWWSQPGLEFIPPSDIAGTVDAPPIVTGNTVALRLRDLADRFVSVVGVMPRHAALDAWRQGQSAWFFSFAARGSNRDTEGRYSHPANFREAALVRGERLAYAATVFARQS